MKHINAHLLIAMANGMTIQARYANLDEDDFVFDTWFDIHNGEEVSFNAVEQLILGFAPNKSVALEFRVKENNHEQ